MENEVVYVVCSLYEDETTHAEVTTCGVFRDKAKASALVKELYEEHMEEEEIDPSKCDEDEAYFNENFACIEPNYDSFRYQAWVDKMEVH